MMSIVPTTKVMDSAEFARVREITTVREFEVFNDAEVRSVVEYSVDRDSLHCQRHKTNDNCACTARVRLSGLLTHTVSKKMPVTRFEETARALAAQEK